MMWELQISGPAAKMILMSMLAREDLVRDAHPESTESDETVAMQAIMERPSKYFWCKKSCSARKNLFVIMMVVFTMVPRQLWAPDPGTLHTNKCCCMSSV